MHVALVGAEIEENLALRYIATSLEQAGHEVVLFDFRDGGQVHEVASAVARSGAELLGLSMIFTARSREFIDLARACREHGFGGHMTAGGHFASLHAASLLADCSAIDTIIHGDGEEPMVELAASLAHPDRVLGLSYRDATGRVLDSGKRSDIARLDDRPWPRRPRQFHTYLGLPIANLLSSRGCYADCAFCSIRAFHQRSGGKRFRQRSVEAVADEMASLYHDRDVRIFNFQDDNFLVPSAAANLARYRALGEQLAIRDVSDIAIQAKGRPDCIDEEVIELLRSLGLFRMFLGVETDAVAGLVTLGRGMDRAHNHRALSILRRQQIHTCFNLLLFDPDSTIETLRHNVGFMRRQDYFPLNFCRVEIYGGTPLEARLQREGRLEGDYQGYGYQMLDVPTQRAYELFRELFWPRNFSFDGTHFGSMKLDYHLHLLRHFFPERVDESLVQQTKALLRELNEHSAALMDRILDFASSDRYEDSVAAADLLTELAVERSAVDASIRQRSEALVQHMVDRGRTEPDRRHFLRAATATAAAIALGAAAGCKKATHTHMCEAPPPPEPYRKLSEAQQKQLQALLQKQLDETLVPKLGERFPNAAELVIRIGISNTGDVQQCITHAPEQRKLVSLICDELRRAPHDVSSLDLQPNAMGYESWLQLAWPAGKVLVPEESPDS